MMRSQLTRQSYRLLSSSPLEYLHIEAGGQLVDFHGWNLPVQYKNMDIIKSSQHCRENASIFDVSHMLQTKIRGPNAWKLLHNLTVADPKNLPENTGTLTLFPNKTGGLIDDLIINKVSGNDDFYVVSNAARADVDLPHMMKEAESLGDVTIDVISNSPLVALQGPKSEEILQNICDADLSKLYFMDGITANIAGKSARITRCGYTGEDGFEISCTSPEIVENILKIGQSNNLQWAGLGERDILRLEGGMCLYGNDINEQTSAYAARLLWTVNKSRRAAADFPGAELLLKEIEEKTPKIGQFRVGLAKFSKGRALRTGQDLYNEDLSEKIGYVTSGSQHANCSEESGIQSIGQAYVKKGFHQNGKEVMVVPGGKKANKKNAKVAVISKMPFVKTNYRNK